MEEAILEELKKISSKLDTLAAILTQKGTRDGRSEYKNNSVRDQIEIARAEAMAKFKELER